MLNHPMNPLGSPYAPSFLAAYRCASGVIKISSNHFDRFPELCCRWWGIWTHREWLAKLVRAPRWWPGLVFSAAVYLLLSSEFVCSLILDHCWNYRYPLSVFEYGTDRIHWAWTSLRYIWEGRNALSTSAQWIGWYSRAQPILPTDQSALGNSAEVEAKSIPGTHSISERQSSDTQYGSIRSSGTRRRWADLIWRTNAYISDPPLVCEQEKEKNGCILFCPLFSVPKSFDRIREFMWFFRFSRWKFAWSSSILGRIPFDFPSTF